MEPQNVQYTALIERYKKEEEKESRKQGDVSFNKKHFLELQNCSFEEIAKIAEQYNKGMATPQERRYLEEYGWTKGLERFSLDGKLYFVPSKTSEAKRVHLGVPKTASHDRLYVLKNQSKQEKSRVALDYLIENFDLPYERSYFANGSLITEYIFIHPMYGAIVHVELDSVGRIVEGKNGKLESLVGYGKESGIRALVPVFAQDNKTTILTNVPLAGFESNVVSLYSSGRHSEDFPSISERTFPKLTGIDNAWISETSAFNPEEKEQICLTLTFKKIMAADESLHKLVGEENMAIIKNSVAKGIPPISKKLGDVNNRKNGTNGKKS